MSRYTYKVAQRWESVEAFTRCVASEASAKDACSKNGLGGYDMQSWCAGITWPQAQKLAREGFPELARDAQKLVDKLTLDSIADVRLPTMAQHVAGARVMVPAFLAGAPDCMLQLQESERPARHVSVYVNVASAGSYEAKGLLVRGAAILGLVEALQCQGMGVDLALVYCPTDSDMFVIGVESRPVDLSTAGFAVGHPAFAREVVYTLAHKRYGQVGGYTDSAAVMRALGCVEGDIYVPRADYGDGLASNPGRWIEDRIRQALEVQS